MLSLAKIFFCFVGINLIAFIGLNLYNEYSLFIPNDNLTPAPNQQLTNETSKSKLQFEIPFLALTILSALDKFQPVNETHFTGKSTLKPGYDRPYYGLQSKDDYCHSHRRHLVYNTESIFESINMVLTAPHGSLVRDKIARPMVRDMHPDVSSEMTPENTKKNMSEIKPAVNYFYTKTKMFTRKHIGQHFSCLTQVSNHIPGQQSLDRKDFVARYAVRYSKKFVDRPQCFSHEKIFPKTWALYNKEDCENFFSVLNSAEYAKLKEERTLVFIRKIAVYSHRGEGVQPINDEEEAAIREDYQNGQLCGNVTKNYIVQNYIHNPLLLNGRKFDFRMYMLIASTNPLIAYYHDGFLRVSLAQYDQRSNEKKVLLTNLALNQQIYDSVRQGNLYEGMDEETLKLAQQWSFERLKDYLLDKGIIKDKDWLDSYLRPEFKKAMIHLLRLSSFSFLKRSSIYELYGVDFMLDENLNLWFIEANSSPAIDGYSAPMEKFIVKMVQDHFRIVMGLLRSRTKRIIDFVNDLTESKVVRRGQDRRELKKVLQKQEKKFASITRNYFEKEFEPSPDNGFQKIIDRNLKDADVYQGLVAAECL